MDSAPAPFVWYELLTPDLDAAADFYGAVIGWDMADSGQPNMRYTLARSGQTPVAGMMALPATLKSQGVPPHWLGYIAASNVARTASDIEGKGGAILHPPEAIPGIGTFAIVSDPQGAVMGLFDMETRPQEAPQGALGHTGWHELSAADGPQAWDFYSRQFGWTKADDMDMGPNGVYRMFSTGGMPVGGMMTRMDASRPPYWMFYVNVGNIDAAVSRTRDHGGHLLNGPMEVPGGSWVAQGQDPQGAYFAMVGSRETSPAA